MSSVQNWERAREKGTQRIKKGVSPAYERWKAGSTDAFADFERSSGATERSNSTHSHSQKNLARSDSSFLSQMSATTEAACADCKVGETSASMTYMSESSAHCTCSREDKELKGGINSWEEKSSCNSLNGSPRFQPKKSLSFEIDKIVEMAASAFDADPDGMNGLRDLSLSTEGSDCFKGGSSEKESPNGSRDVGIFNSTSFPRIVALGRGSSDHTNCVSLGGSLVKTKEDNGHVRITRFNIEPVLSNSVPLGQPYGDQHLLDAIDESAQAASPNSNVTKPFFQPAGEDNHSLSLKTDTASGFESFSFQSPAEMPRGAPSSRDDFNRLGHETEQIFSRPPAF
jgi:hypothetical protein